MTWPEAPRSKRPLPSGTGAPSSVPIPRTETRRPAAAARVAAAIVASGSAPADLDEATLEQIAAQTGGAYFRAKNVEALAKVYREIDRLEPVVAEPRYIRPSRELFVWPLATSLFLTLAVALASIRPDGLFAAGWLGEGKVVR